MVLVEEVGENLDLSPMDHDDDLAADDLRWCNVRSSFAIFMCGSSSCGRPLTSFNDIICTSSLIYFHSIALLQWWLQQLH